MKIKKHIPNTLTTLNLVGGLFSVISTFEGNLALASLFIFIAALLDYLDGTVARLLKVYSELGKQLDSLADLVSFGVAPGILMYQLLLLTGEGSPFMFDQRHIAPYFALLIPVCSALRLAKFNIDLKQAVNFIGLPTPANALFFAAIPLVLYVQPGVYSIFYIPGMVDFFSNPRILTILTVFFSYLLISDFWIFSMKFKSMQWAGNQLRYIFLMVSLVLALLFFLQAIPIIIILYVLMSVFFQQEG